MKHLISTLLIIFVITSCSKDYDFESNKYPQKWALIEMTGQTPNSVKTGENMTWQEYYILKADGTFIKHREQDGVKYEASGDYTFQDKTDGKYLELAYDTDSEIIGSCLANQTENLRLTSATQLMGTWLACDGPGLEYKRVE